PQGLPKERVALAGAAERREEIGTLEVRRVDRGDLDEVENLDGLGGADVGAPEVLVGDQNVAVVAERVALDDVAPGDFLAGSLVDRHVAHGRAVPAIERVEG